MSPSAPRAGAETALGCDPPGLGTCLAEVSTAPLLPLNAPALHDLPGKLTQLRARLQQRTSLSPLLLSMMTGLEHQEYGELLRTRDQSFGQVRDVLQRAGVARSADLPAGLLDEAVTTWCAILERTHQIELACFDRIAYDPTQLPESLRSTGANGRLLVRVSPHLAAPWCDFLQLRADIAHNHRQLERTLRLFIPPSAQAPSKTDLWTPLHDMYGEFCDIQVHPEYRTGVFVDRRSALFALDSGLDLLARHRGEALQGAKNLALGAMAFSTETHAADARSWLRRHEAHWEELKSFDPLHVRIELNEMNEVVVRAAMPAAVDAQLDPESLENALRELQEWARPRKITLSWKIAPNEIQLTYSFWTGAELSKALLAQVKSSEAPPRVDPERFNISEPGTGGKLWFQLPPTFLDSETSRSLLRDARKVARAIHAADPGLCFFAVTSDTPWVSRPASGMEQEFGLSFVLSSTGFSSAGSIHLELNEPSDPNSGVTPERYRWVRSYPMRSLFLTQAALAHPDTMGLLSKLLKSVELNRFSLSTTNTPLAPAHQPLFFRNFLQALDLALHENWSVESLRGFRLEVRPSPQSESVLHIFVRDSNERVIGVGYAAVTSPTNEGDLPRIHWRKPPLEPTTEIVSMITSTVSTLSPELRRSPQWITAALAARRVYLGDSILASLARTLTALPDELTPSEIQRHCAQFLSGMVAETPTLQLSSRLDAAAAKEYLIRDLADRLPPGWQLSPSVR